jgi:hypothetical protein
VRTILTPDCGHIRELLLRRRRERQCGARQSCKNAAVIRQPSRWTHHPGDLPPDQEPGHGKPAAARRWGILAEVDGNLVAIKDTNTLLVEVTTHGKFRGPDFAPLTFKLVPVQSPKLVDSKGTSIYAQAVSNAEQEVLKGIGDMEQCQVLRVMLEHPEYSLTEIATHLGWLTGKGGGQQAESSPADDEDAERPVGGEGSWRSLHADQKGARGAKRSANRPEKQVKRQNRQKYNL